MTDLREKVLKTHHAHAACKGCVELLSLFEEFGQELIGEPPVTVAICTDPSCYQYGELHGHSSSEDRIKYEEWEKRNDKLKDMLKEK